MNSYTCPTEPRQYVDGTDIVGCGTTFKAQADADGIVDCPQCGIWFKPELEAVSVHVR